MIITGALISSPKAAMTEIRMFMALDNSMIGRIG
jgi:hypothetical protein